MPHTLNAADNIAIVTRFLTEVWNQGKASTIDELYAPDGTADGLGEEHRQGPEQFKQFHQLFLSTCHNINMQLKDAMAEGDKVAIMATLTATHRLSGTSFSFDGGGFARIENGKIVEAYNTWNFLDMLIQLKAVPADILPTALQGEIKAVNC